MIRSWYTGVIWYSKQWLGGVQPSVLNITAHSSYWFSGPLLADVKVPAKIENSSVNTAHSARNLGFIFDVSHLFRQDLISVQSCSYRIHQLRYVDSLGIRALDLQLDGCEFNSWLRRYWVTTLGKLFTPKCLCRSQWLSDGMIDCGVRGRGLLCLSRQPLRCTALGMGCAPFLQWLCRFSLPPSIGRWNEYQLLGWVIITNGDGGYGW